jgi:hypothetical protein
LLFKIRTQTYHPISKTETSHTKAIIIEIFLMKFK